MIDALRGTRTGEVGVVAGVMGGAFPYTHPASLEAPKSSRDGQTVLIGFVCFDKIG